MQTLKSAIESQHPDSVQSVLQCLDLYHVDEEQVAAAIRNAVFHGAGEYQVDVIQARNDHMEQQVHVCQHDQMLAQQQQQQQQQPSAPPPPAGGKKKKKQGKR
eukprot:TRINITY_DN4134_c0_g5_i1.p1 TRINITY_DN4134_c0_g5~~TRINITY_DN4134_c0_g5_i1.p1  ORF type:complete len:103 (+),score=35.15 TRINITY_DN4134_c0_g5_i1:244-552(+)